MKKNLIGIFLLCIFMFSVVFLLKKFYYKDIEDKSITIKNEELNWKIKYKGLNNAVDFVADDSNNYYIAYKNKIQVIKNNGQSYDLFMDNSLNVYSLDYYNENIYFSSGTNIYCFNLKDKKLNKLLDSLPNYGDYKDSLIKIKGEYLYITIGAATNSGIVGEDNTWVKDTPYIHDITPKDITIKGLNFAKDKTGAFQSYRTKSLKGQIIPEHFPGNASVIIYNFKTGNSETYAWGIRNITGMDFTNEGKLIASIGGIEDRGSRPVKGDSDYLYEIKKGNWYGWPDYSGGDPVTSPRFKSDKYGVTQFILENHPTTNPPAPIYQHKLVSSIRSLAIDNNSVIGEKNCIYFYDKLDNVVYKFSGAGPVKEEIKFSENSQVSNIKFKGKELLILDKNKGYLYNVEKVNEGSEFKLDKRIYGYLIVLTVFGMVLAVLKFEKRNS